LRERELRADPRRSASAPRVRLPRSASQRASAGNAASRESRSEEPAQIPATNGSTTRSATSGPSRLVKKSRTVSPDGIPRRRKGPPGRSPSSSPERPDRNREVGQGAQEGQAVVQAGRPPEVSDPGAAGRFREELVHLVKRLDVVADERDGNDEQLFDPGPPQP